MSLDEKVKDIEKTTQSILNIYENLARLDLESKKSSIEYQKYIDYLNIAIDVEEQKYSKLTNDELKQIEKIEINDKLVRERILQKSDHKIILEDDEVARTMAVADTQTDAVKQLFYSFLEEEIKKRKNLINFKYLSLFTNVTIEPSAVMKNFDMSSNINILIEDTSLEIPFEELINYTCYVNVSQIIKKILIKKSFDRNDESNIINLLKIRAYLVLLNLENRNKLLKLIDKIARDYQINKICLVEIYKLFNQTENDKEKHKINKLKI